MEQPSEFAFASAPEGIGESIWEDEQLPELLEAAAGADSDTAVEFRRTHGMTANAFMSVSLQPPLIVISVDRRARMNNLLREGVQFGVSVLEEGQSVLSDRFAGRDTGGPEPVFELVHETP